MDEAVSLREMEFDKKCKNDEKHTYRFILGRGEQESFEPLLP